VGLRADGRAADRRLRTGCPRHRRRAALHGLARRPKLPHLPVRRSQAGCVGARLRLLHVLGPQPVSGRRRAGLPLLRLLGQTSPPCRQARPLHAPAGRRARRPDRRSPRPARLGAMRREQPRRRRPVDRRGVDDRTGRRVLPAVRRAGYVAQRLRRRGLHLDLAAGTVPVRAAQPLLVQARRLHHRRRTRKLLPRPARQPLARRHPAHLRQAHVRAADRPVPRRIRRRRRAVLQHPLRRLSHAPADRGVGPLDRPLRRLDAAVVPQERDGLLGPARLRTRQRLRRGCADVLGGRRRGRAVAPGGPSRLLPRERRADQLRRARLRPVGTRGGRPLPSLPAGVVGGRHDVGGDDRPSPRRPGPAARLRRASRARAGAARAADDRPHARRGRLRGIRPADLRPRRRCAPGGRPRRGGGALCRRRAFRPRAVGACRRGRRLQRPMGHRAGQTVQRLDGLRSACAGPAGPERRRGCLPGRRRLQRQRRHPRRAPADTARGGKNPAGRRPVQTTPASRRGVRLAGECGRLCQRGVTGPSRPRRCRGPARRERTGRTRCSSRRSPS